MVPQSPGHCTELARQVNMSIQSILVESPAGCAGTKDLFVQATSSLTFLLRAWPAWIACPETASNPTCGFLDPLTVRQHLGAPLGTKLRVTFAASSSAPLVSACFLDRVLHRRDCCLNRHLLASFTLLNHTVWVFEILSSTEHALR